MLPSPTPEAFLFMALVGALTDDLPPKKCARFRWAMRKRLGADNPRIAVLRQAIPTLDDARDGAIVILCGSCAICERRESCTHPVE